MASRRTTTKVEVPIPSSSATPTTTNTTSKSPTLDQPPATTPKPTSPFLPTLLESLLLSLYPATLVLGSLFSAFHPSTRHSTYNPSTQSYDAATAPSYFAKKSNIFNVYFVKRGWLWASAAFFLLLFTHSSLGPPLQWKLTRKRAQAIARYVSVSLVWVVVTQWFFGPGLIDRSFRWTGGKCAEVLAEGPGGGLGGFESGKGDFEQAFSHAACRAIGGSWTGGHDISGHVFLLILSSAMLWLELLPAVLRSDGLREARQVRTRDGSVRSASMDFEDGSRVPSVASLSSVNARSEQDQRISIGVRFALGVVGSSWWMLLMTAAYFHTWFEKVTGLLVAFLAVYAVYFLPRGIPAMRKVLGMPGV